MEDRRAHANQRRGQQQQCEARRNRQQQQTQQGKDHADRQGVRQGLAVGVLADKGLQDRRRHLIGKRQQTDLTEIQMERGLQDWIDGRQKGLHRIIEQMAKTHRYEHPKQCSLFDQAGALDLVGRLIGCLVRRNDLRSHAGCLRISSYATASDSVRSETESGNRVSNRGGRSSGSGNEPRIAVADDQKRAAGDSRVGERPGRYGRSARPFPCA